MFMIRISELQLYLERYRARKKALLERDTIHGYITFIEEEQGKQTKKVITLEQRETARRLRELGKRQEEKKPFDPEEEFANL